MISSLHSIKFWGTTMLNVFISLSDKPMSKRIVEHLTKEKIEVTEDSPLDVNNNQGDILAIKKPSCEKEWITFLVQLGFNYVHIGTDYLASMLSYINYTNSYNIKLNTLYKELSVKLNIPSSNIQWNIEKAIKFFRENTEEKVIKTYFPNYVEDYANTKYIIKMLSRL